MTATAATNRDYSIVGPESAQAVERGLANGAWFQAHVDPARMRELTRRQNLRPAIDLGLWVGLVIGSGILAWSVRDTWWAIPAFLLYGALAGGAADARWHECGHGTAFRTGWMNDLVYFPASFMLARGATHWRWSHFRHHTDTIIVGRDAEIVFPRPQSLPRFLAGYTHLEGGFTMMATIVRHAFGRPDPDVAELVPVSERRRVVIEARIYVTIWVGAVVWSAVTLSPWPILFVGGPTIYGAWLMVFFGATQHAGLQEDVLDHRYSTRTVLMNPVFRFLYLNMNYHVEHHMFPAVPYYRLPALHAEIRDQLVEPLPNTVAAYREIFHALRRQAEDTSWELDRAVPDVPSAGTGRIVQGFEWPTGSVAPTAVTPGAIDLGPVPVEPGTSTPVEIDDRPMLLVCTDDGGLHVIDRICSHGDADLALGAVVGNEIECPKHNGRFDVRTGTPTRRPVTVAIRSMHARRDGSHVVAATAEDAAGAGDGG